MNKNNKDIEETLDIKRENYKLRKENFELLQDNAKLLEEINRLNYKLKEKICFEGHSQFKELNKELETYKKIAEKLADEIQSIDNGICESLYATNKCQYTGTKDQIKCIPCIIDWARKEVLKDE